MSGVLTEGAGWIAGTRGERADKKGCHSNSGHMAKAAAGRGCACAPTQGPSEEEEATGRDRDKPDRDGEGLVTSSTPGAVAANKRGSCLPDPDTFKTHRGRRRVPDSGHLSRKRPGSLRPCRRFRLEDGSGFDLPGDGVQHLQDLLNGRGVFYDAVCGEGQGGFAELKIPFAHMVTGGRLDPLEGA